MYMYVYASVLKLCTSDSSSVLTLFDLVTPELAGAAAAQCSADGRR